MRLRCAFPNADGDGELDLEEALGLAQEQAPIHPTSWAIEAEDIIQKVTGEKVAVGGREQASAVTHEQFRRAPHHLLEHFAIHGEL